MKLTYREWLLLHAALSTAFDAAEGTKRDEYRTLRSKTEAAFGRAYPEGDNE